METLPSHASIDTIQPLFRYFKRFGYDHMLRNVQKHQDSEPFETMTNEMNGMKCDQISCNLEKSLACHVTVIMLKSVKTISCIFGQPILQSFSCQDSI